MGENPILSSVKYSEISSDPFLTSAQAFFNPGWRDVARSYAVHGGIYPFTIRFIVFVFTFFRDVIQPTAGYPFKSRWVAYSTLDTNTLAGSSDLGSAECEALRDNTYLRDKGQTTIPKAGLEPEILRTEALDCIRS